MHDQGVEIDRADHQVRTLGEHAEVVAAAGHEAVHGDAVAGGRVQGDAVDQDIVADAAWDATYSGI